MTIRYRQPVNPDRFLAPLYRALDDMHDRYWGTESSVQWECFSNNWVIVFTIRPPYLTYEWRVAPDSRKIAQFCEDIQNEVAVDAIIHNLRVKEPAFN